MNECKVPILFAYLYVVPRGLKLDFGPYQLTRNQHGNTSKPDLSLLQMRRTCQIHTAGLSAKHHTFEALTYPHKTLYKYHIEPE